MNITIKTLSGQDHIAVMSVVEALPEWFNEDAREREIPVDLRFHNGFVALNGDKVVGFILLVVSGGRMHISWLGVHPDFHRQGVGKNLLLAAENFSRSVGVCELEVFTLGDSVEYEPFVATRAFYQAQGFQIFLSAQTDDPGCPEEIRLKKNIC